ncbi:MAG: heat-shock protein Hsp20 [Pseudopedobacter saltans]|uniref:Heat-shock protein Hsp20 n=1 Tax=Pseudopedobacter saltans TaxID=151895 RepID=A0A2W5HCY4_9SPHI|nr:MAG: heat-shock protein Hsp20 [Pseudopedobacter saltans]
MFFNTVNNDRNRQHGHGFGRGSFKGRCGEGFFGNKENWKQMFANRFGNTPSVNIEEREDSFLVCLYAAGLSKDSFKLSVQDNVLTISYEASKDTSERKFLYQENDLSSFERSFQLNGQVLTDQISAAYVDGVLAISLPKDPEAQQAGQEIKIN